MAAPLSAQSITGFVRDAVSRQPIAGVDLLLLERDGSLVNRTVTRADGKFVLVTRSAGVYRVHAEHIAYGAVTSDTIIVRATEQVGVDIALAETAFELEALRVVSRRWDPRLDATEDGLYARRLASAPIGNARVFLASDPEMAYSRDPGDLLRWWVSARRPCTAVYWNGLLVQDRAMADEWLNTPTSHLEAVEYYRTPIDAPPVFRELPAYLGFDNAFCSVVALWPRSGRYLLEPPPPRGNPYEWRAYATASAQRLGGSAAPGTGVAFEVGTHWPVSARIGLGLSAKGAHHRLGPETTADLTRYASDLQYVLPPGARTLRLFVVGAGPRVIVHDDERARVLVDAHLLAAQRQFTIRSTMIGAGDALARSRGWGFGAAASVERMLSPKLGITAALGGEWYSFGPYDKLDREPADTRADWTGISLRVGMVYDIGRDLR